MRRSLPARLHDRYDHWRAVWSAGSSPAFSDTPSPALHRPKAAFWRLCKDGHLRFLATLSRVVEAFVFMRSELPLVHLEGVFYICVDINNHKPILCISSVCTMIGNDLSQTKDANHVVVEGFNPSVSVFLCDCFDSPRHSWPSMY